VRGDFGICAVVFGPLQFCFAFPFYCCLALIALRVVKSLVAQILFFAAVFQLLGGHWAILQTAAWVGMAIEYSSHDGLQAGLAKTFDGRHPCEICKSIAKHKGTEKKHLAQLEFGKVNFVSGTQASVLYPPEQCWHQRLSTMSLSSVSRTPPVPPPRGLIG
jgi:hypothetical protein